MQCSPKALPAPRAPLPSRARRGINALASASLIASLTACATAPALVPTAAPAGNYTLDPTHARVNFSLSHAGLSQYTARFDTVSGTLNFDPERPENSRVDISIDPASVSTGLKSFDETLAFDGKYFDARTYPQITFTSDTITVTGPQTGQITGALSFRGVTRPLTLDTTFNGAGASFGHAGKTLGFSARGTLLRSEFGLSHLVSFGIGDEVSLQIEAEFNESRP